MNLFRNFLKKEQDFSVLNILSDGANWALDEEAKSLMKVCGKLGINSRIVESIEGIKNQCLHLTDQFTISNERLFTQNNRISFDYYHGRADQGPEFEKVVNDFKSNIDKFHRVRVSNSTIENYVLSLGYDRSKLFRIPIGIDLEQFSPPTKEEKENVRKELGIPDNSFVIGSFQKDGNGWGEGLEPKLVKGPDVFLKTLEILHNNYPNIFILLTGPARGYVKKGLDDLGIKYRHDFFENYNKISHYYKALDLYIISSREEGGPKSILESMSMNVPLVTTRVGQAIDIVDHGINGWVAEVEDYDSLAKWSSLVIENKTNLKEIVSNGRKTAESNSIESLSELWKIFFSDYIR